MNDSDQKIEQLMLERILEEIRAMRQEMNQNFDEMLRKIDSISQQLRAMHHRLSNISESNKEIPEEFVN